MARGQYSEESAEATMLRSAPEKDYEFDRAALRDVLRFLANDAGISFVSVPEASEAEEKLVTFTLRTSPFRALEIIAKANGVALFYEDGVWYLRPFDDKELVARTYKIKFNTQEKVTYDPSAQSQSSTATNTTGGSGTGPDVSLSLEGATDVFKVEKTEDGDGDVIEIVKDIRALIGIPTSGFDASVLSDTGVGSDQVLGTSPSSVRPRSPDGGAASPEETEEPAQQVLWSSDSNTLYVVATRQQQRWVEGYLASVDRPQALIAIEVKFFESTKDPRKQLGLDWAGTLQEGYGVQVTDINVAATGAINITNDNTAQRASGTPPAGLDTFDYYTGDRNYTATVAAPYSAVLSADNLAVRLRAFLNDRDTTTVSYPRVLTRNNREVVIRSVVNTPVLASSSSVTPGVGGTTTASISYLPIGTIINVLPKKMDDGSIGLNVAITISTIIRFEDIGGNLYPVVSSRVYNAALDVRSGYSLAIGGLEEAFDRTADNGVPLLKDIPLLGELFKSSDRNQSKKNLMLFITPTLLPARSTTGVDPKPESTIPVTPDLPRPPAFTPDGQLIGGAAAVPAAVVWLNRERRYYQELIKENRIDKKGLAKIEELIAICKLLAQQLEIERIDNPNRSSRIDDELARLAQLDQALLELLNDGRKAIITF